jgi:hypothetical protein
MVNLVGLVVLIIGIAFLIGALYVGINMAVGFIGILLVIVLAIIGIVLIGYGIRGGINVS